MQNEIIAINREFLRVDMLRGKLLILRKDISIFSPVRINVKNDIINTILKINCA
jgi:hypothetical protein